MDGWLACLPGWVCGWAGGWVGMGRTGATRAAHPLPHPPTCPPPTPPSQVANGYRPPVSARVPAPIRDIIEFCWKGNPALRPNTRAVVRMLQARRVVRRVCVCMGCVGRARGKCVEGQKAPRCAPTRARRCACSRWVVCVDFGQHNPLPPTPLTFTHPLPYNPPPHPPPSL